MALLNPRRKNVGKRRQGPARSWRSSVAYKEVAFMVKEKYLRKWEGAYMLGSGSLPYMPDAPKFRKLARNRILRSYPETGTVKHDLLITHLLVLLDMAKCIHPDRWDYFIHLGGEEPKLRVKDKGGEKKYIKLDKLVSVVDKDRDEKHNFFIEADRSTAALITNLPKKRNVRSRARGFFQFHTDGGIPLHFGLPGARLVFICPKGRNQRIQNIKETVRRTPNIPNQTTVFKYMTAEPVHFDNPGQFVVRLCYDRA